MKQVIVVRMDIKMDKGKMSAQVAHASVEAAMKSSKDKLESWQLNGAKKVVLKAKDDRELLALQSKAKALKLKTALIIDAGRTALAPGTMTCLGIGPDSEAAIDKVTGHLKMM